MSEPRSAEHRRRRLLGAHPWIQALTQSSTGGVVVELDGMMVLANDVAASLLGAPSVAALEGASPHACGLVASELRGAALGRGVPLIGYDGSTRHVVVETVPLELPDGEATLFLVDAPREVEPDTQVRRIAGLRPDELEAAQRLGELGAWSWDVGSDTLRGASDLAALLHLPATTPSCSAFLEALDGRILADDRARARWQLETLLRTGQPVEDQLRVKDGRGETRWLVVRAALRQNGREAQTVVGVVQDVTSRHTAVEAENRFAVLFECSPDATLVLDTRGRILLANGAAARLFGASSEQLKRGTVQRYVPDGVWEDIVERGTTPPFTIFRADFGEVPVEVGLSTASLGDEPVVIAMFHDCSQRIYSERALRESEERYRTLFEQAADGIFLSDIDGRYIDVNEAGLRLTRFTRDELLGKTLFDLTPPEVRDSIRLDLLQPGVSRRTERELLRSDGTRFWAELSATRLPGGRLQGIVRDVTERKRAQEALREAQKLDAVGRLAGGIAHDFNNLLTVVLTLSAELQARFASSEDATAMLDDIVHAAERAGQLTRQLLSFARAQPATPRIVDLSDEVRGFVRILGRTLGPDVRIELSLSERALLVFIDPVHVSQVLLNLGVNARDAMPQGGALAIRTAREGRFAVLDVSDEGQGMDQHVLAHLFEPFFTTKEVGKGTGLGLSTVYGIVQGAGGSIDVKSTPGAGTTFSIRIPLAESRARASSSVQLEAIPAVLAVGTPASLASWEPLRAHASVSIASDERTALGELTQRAFRAIVVELDGLDGEPAAIVARLHAAAPDAPMVLTTGNLAAHAELAAFGVLVPRSEGPDALAGQLNRVLSWRRER